MNVAIAFALLVDRYWSIVSDRLPRPCASKHVIREENGNIIMQLY